MELIHFLTLVLVLGLHAPAVAGETPEEKPADFWHRETLTGNWGGVRQTLADHGVNFEFVYTGEVSTNVSGGLNKKAVYLDNVDMILNIDAERLVHWKGASFYVYGVGNQGGSPSDNAGDAQGVSNIDTLDAWKLYSAWFQQNLWKDRFSILVGLYDINSEFDTMETAAVFLNSSHGIGPDYSQSGLNGPSVFPNLSFGGRLLVRPINNLYIQTAVLDGVPGTPNSPTATAIRFDSGDGVLVASEVGYTLGEITEDTPAGKVAVGNWVYTGQFDDQVAVDTAGDPVQRGGNFGIYALAEYLVLRESKENDQGLSLFGRAGYANPNINRFQYYIGSGAAYKGLFPGRDDDILGLAVATAWNGSPYRQAQAAAGTPAKRTKVNLELTYLAQIFPWFAIHPDVQLILSPDTQQQPGHSLNLGTRFEIVF